MVLVRNGVNGPPPSSRRFVRGDARRARPREPLQLSGEAGAVVVAGSELTVLVGGPTR